MRSRPHARAVRGKLPSLLTLLGVALAAQSARAQSNPGDVPLGGRSTLLGGTGVALGRDGSSPFLNPATMGRIADHRLAFSVNFYRYSFTRIDQLIRAPEGVLSASESVSQSAFGSLPGSFCAFATISGIIPEEATGLWHTVRGHAGRTKLGLCGATIEREQFIVDAEARTFADSTHHARAAYNLQHAWQRQSVGPSLSYQLAENVTVGATLQIVTTSARRIWDFAAIVDDSSGRVYQHHLVGNATSGVTTLGLTWIHRPITLGLSARLPSIGFSNSARVTQYAAANSTAVLTTGSGSFTAPLPPILAVGVGAEWEKTSLEFNASITFPTVSELKTTLRLASGNAAPLVGVTSSERIKPSVAWRLGTEHHFSPTLSFLLGARYEPTSVRNGFPNPAFRLGPMSRNLVAASAGFGSYGSGMELLIGLELSHAFGRLPTVSELSDSASYTEAKFQNTSALLVLSGSIGLSAVKRTWKNIRQLKPLPPRRPEGHRE